MIRFNSDNSSEKFILDIGLTIGSLGAGAYHGFCDAQGLPFENQNIEYALTYAPTIIRSGVGTVKGGLIGLIGGGILGNEVGAVKGGFLGAGFGSVGCGILGAGVGAVKGGIQTLIGYGIGYTAGYLTR